MFKFDARAIISIIVSASRGSCTTKQEMPPVLRLWQGHSQGSCVEAPEPPPQFSRPTPGRRLVPVLRLDPEKLRPEGFTYHDETTAVVAETSDFVEVSDGPPGSGLSIGERHARDGTWTEKFVHQLGTASKGKGKGRDFGRRMGKNLAGSQRWKESWERTEANETEPHSRIKVERHVQTVDNIHEDDPEVLQEWDEDEEDVEIADAGSLSSEAGRSSSSSASTNAKPMQETARSDGHVLKLRRWVQKGKDRKTGRVWSRTITLRKVCKGREVVSESEEECHEQEVDGEERHSTRHRVGQSLETSESGMQPSGNRWRSKYCLQTLTNYDGRVCCRESVEKWHRNEDEEQSEQWDTVDEFSCAPSSAMAAGPQSAPLQLRRRMRSGRKDGKKHHDKCEEWHERWEEQEEPAEVAAGVRVLQIRKKKLEKWWRENACNNSWGEHQIEHFSAAGADTIEHRKWYDNGHECQNETWTEHPDGTADGTKEGHREGESWGEQWSRTSDGDDGTQTITKWHDDGFGGKVTSKEGKRWIASKNVEWHREEFGEVVGQSKQWTVKVGGNATGDAWFEKWSERQSEKSAEKHGRNAQGDQWREIWNEEYDAEGIRIRQRAEKEGSNSQGDKWYETWIEEQEKKKQTLKKGEKVSGEKWQEEWGEEAKDDGSGTKWTSKWADDGLGACWGENWGDECHAGGGGGKRWVESWDSRGKNEKHSHESKPPPSHL